MLVSNQKLGRKSKNSYFRDSNPTFARLLPLLQGAIFYKKFSSRQSLKLNVNAFDPLNADKIPPESCGYGLRFIQLDQSLKYINIRQNLKNQIEYQIPITDILRPILPQITTEIIKIQKDKRYRNQKMDCSPSMLEEFLIFEKKSTSISHLAKMGVLNKNSDLYRKKCM